MVQQPRVHDVRFSPCAIKQRMEVTEWDKNPQDIVAIPCHLVTVCVNESSKLSLGADLFFLVLGEGDSLKVLNES